jgi:hypothetical protein
MTGDATPITDAETTIACDRAVFDGLLGWAESAAAAEEWAAAVGYAQVAGNYAFWHHPGLWSSFRLERILGNIGERVIRANFRTNHTVRQTTTDILHVLTTAYSLGGHTRMVWRWIQQDHERSHSIAITRQGNTAVPRQLVEAVENAGGRIYFLDEERGGALARAQALREIGMRFDRAVLHLHPGDVVPIIAFCQNQQRPPVVTVNHADHIFWLGVGISDVVLHLRDSGVAVSTELRGIERNRCMILPVPLNPLHRTVPQLEAKKQLGLRENETVLLSIASGYKYDPILGETDFVEALVPVLLKHQNTVLVVVGPDGQGQWERGARESQGRIRSFGKRGDTAVFYQAADIYLDSFPFASTTSFLEAGSYGLPIVSFCPLEGAAAVLCADSPGLEATMVRAKNLERYRMELSTLIGNPEMRSQLGERARKTIISTHMGESWRLSLDNIYADSGRISRAAIRSKEVDVSHHCGQLDVRLVHLYERHAMSRNLNETIRDEAGLLPFFHRLGLWSAKPNRRLSFLPRFLLSEWTRTRLRRWLSGNKRAISQEALLP